MIPNFLKKDLNMLPKRRGYDDSEDNVELTNEERKALRFLLKQLDSGKIITRFLIYATLIIGATVQGIVYIKEHIKFSIF